jgi:hypothetical protein
MNDLLRTLQTRFESHPQRHPAIAWADVQARLEHAPDALATLFAMEASGGEPDVIGRDEQGRLLFCDCCAESPAGRRSLCYDREALDARKAHKPRSSAVEEAAAMGVELLSEEQYRALQALGEFDGKTSSWIATPADVRALGGALFADRRYGRVFVYHNGAQSYYAVRGFRGLLRV